MRLAAGLLISVISTCPAAELPAGLKIEVRLQTRLASNTAKPGNKVQAMVISPVLIGGQMIIPPGSTLTGKVKAARPAQEGEDRALLGLEFGELRVPGQKPVKIEARVEAVDNARETIDKDGQIVGIQASETLSSQIDKGIEKLNERAAGLAGILQAAKAAIVKPADPEITYDQGVEMTLQLAKSVRAGPAAGSIGGVAPIPNEAALIDLVTRQPFRTVAQKPPQPSDITNLMFIGSQQQLEAAFDAAGWKPAAARNVNSELETARAIIENRGYQEAPVSVLLLEGRAPDLVFQKQNNTFAKRHHLRIWKRPDIFQGQAVWVCAATHDIGIDFSPQNRTFIHKIDSHIDAERAKVINDLLLTGKVSGLALVERPAVPKNGYNATGDEIKTDGSMAVVLLKTDGAPGR
jgi:hypothetical protein